MKQLLQVQRSFEHKAGEPRHLFLPCCEQFVTLSIWFVSQIHFLQIQIERSDWRLLRSFFWFKILHSPLPLWGMLRIDLCSWFLCVNSFWFCDFFLIKWRPLSYLALCPFSVDYSKGNLTSYILLSLQSFTFCSCLHPRMRETSSHLSVAIKYTYRSCMMRLHWKVEKEEGVLVSAVGSFIRRSIQKHKEEDNGMRLFCGLPS